jgi:hypothetical protein
VPYNRFATTAICEAVVQNADARWPPHQQYVVDSVNRWALLVDLLTAPPLPQASGARIEDLLG